MIQTFEGDAPRVHVTAFVHPSAWVVGDVVLEEEASVWPGCVLRGDVGAIRIGARSNLQDLSVCHTTGGVSECIVGARVTVGHRVILHGCIIEDEVLVGMGAVVMDNAVIPTGSIVAAGALVPPGKRYPPGKLLLGQPARAVRDVTDVDRARIADGWQHYIELSRRHAAALADAG